MNNIYIQTELMKNTEIIKNILREVSEPKEFDIVYRAEDTLLVAPLTKTAACRYGSGTKWCSAAPDDDNRWRGFESLRKKGILFYLLIYKTDEEGNKQDFYKISIYKTVKTGFEMWEDMTGKRIMNLAMMEKFIIPDPMIKTKLVEYWKKHRSEWRPKFKVGDYVKPDRDYGWTNFKDIKGNGELSIRWNDGVYLVVGESKERVQIQLVRVSKETDESTREWQIKDKKKINDALHSGQVFRKWVNPYGFKVV